MKTYSNNKTDLFPYSVAEVEFAQRMRRYKAIIFILLVANFVAWISALLILAAGA